MRFMSTLLSLMMVLLLLAPEVMAKKTKLIAPSPIGKELKLDPIYLRPDGAIMTLTSGQLVDPYFPTKALLIAQDSGMDISKIAGDWIKWMLARQDSSGLFFRYCFKENEATYTACAEADADDAMLAMWIELLYRMAPRKGLPKEWKESADKAEYQLNSIYNPKATVFFVSKSMQAGLLMDNIEIYSAFKRIEREAVRLGEGKKSVEYRGKAEQLKIGIIGNFWDDKNKRFTVSTQARTENKFYPDVVDQLVPMMHGFSITKIPSENSFYKSWIKHHKNEWFALLGKDYPWGLLAVMAEKRGDYNTAGCWMKLSAPSRHTKLWNVMDETAFQIVEWKLGKKKIDDKQCAGGAL